jgi:hypothetical protein
MFLNVGKILLDKSKGRVAVFKGEHAQQWSIKTTFWEEA